jgi:hypothetical protein
LSLLARSCRLLGVFEFVYHVADSLDLFFVGLLTHNEILQRHIPEDEVYLRLNAIPNAFHPELDKARFIPVIVFLGIG